MTGPAASSVIYLAIMGGIAFALGLFAIYNLLALFRLVYAASASGTITARRIDRDEGTFYHVTYAFRDASGEAHEREIQVSRRIFDGLAEGQTVRVLYQPERPTNSHLGEAGAIRYHALSMFGALLIAGVLGFIAYRFIGSCVVGDTSC
jgi:hypothetical protein